MQNPVVAFLFFVFFSFPQSAETKADSLEIYCKCLSAFFAKVLKGFLWDLLHASRV